MHIGTCNSYAATTLHNYTDYIFHWSDTIGRLVKYTVHWMA